MRAAIFVFGVVVLAAIGCGEVTTEDQPDAGRGTGGGAGRIDNQGTGGVQTMAGVGGAPAGTGGSGPGAGGARAYPFCAPTETLTVDTAICQKLQPGGTYKNSMRDGYVCALCDPASPTGSPVSNLPCLYTNRLCVQDCTTECN